MLPLLVLLGTIAGAWYLLIVRPQQQQQTQHGALVSQLQIGNHVLTVGGIFGRVVGINGSMVDVELSGPGSVTRIATDAIARIVPGSPDLPDPNANANARPPVTNMQQHPNEQSAPHMPQPAPGGFVAPPLPTFSQPTYIQQVTQPAPVPAAGHTTLRAQVMEVAPLPPAPILTPWADVAPRHAVGAPAPVQPQHAPAPSYPAPISPGFQLAHQQLAHQQVVHQPVVAPQYVHAPQPQQHYVASAYPPPQVGAPQVAIPAPHVAQDATHAHIPAPQYHVQAPAPAPAAPAQALETDPGRKRSRAPQGMGSSLRLDDPSLQDTMTRARNERAGLADEYRRVVAPLVDLATEAAPQQVQYAAPAPHGAHPAQAAAAPNGLFAQAPAAGHPHAAMPRPHIAAPTGQIDPAFQRRTPMTHAAEPQVHAQAPATAPGVPA